MAETSKSKKLQAIKEAYTIHAAVFNPKSPDFLSFEGFNDLCFLKNVSLLTVKAEEGKVKGYILFRNSGEEAEILSLAVEKSQQKQGVGKDLVGKMLTELKNANCQAVFLEVNEENRAAREVYRSFGAEQVSVRKAYYRGPDHTKQNALIKKIPIR